MSLLHRLNDRLDRAWPTASLRTYLFAVMLLATLPLATLMSLQIFIDIRTEQAQTEEELARSAAAFALSVQRQLRSSLDGLGVLAQSELFQQGRIAALGRLLHGRARGDWDSVFLLDRDGSVVLDTGPPGPPAGLGLRELHQRVLRSRQPAVSGLNEQQRPGNRAIAVARPVVHNGAVRYVLGARMGEAVWQRLSSTASTPAAGHAAVFDADGRLIGYSRATMAPPGAMLPSDAAAAMQGRPAGVERTSDIDGRTVYAAWRDVPFSGWRVWVALPAAPIDAAHRQALLSALAASGGSLLLGLLLAALVARRVTRPLRQLAIGGAAGLGGHVAVREIGLLRDALRQTRTQDTASHVALQTKAQEFETLFDSSPIGMAFAQDPACRVVSHNAAMDALIGPRGSQKAGSVRVLHQGRLLAPGEQPLQRAAGRGETVTGMELEIAIDGRPSTFVMANAVPLRDDRGRPRGAISALVDITDQVHTERERAQLTAQAVAAQREAEAASRAKDEFLTMLSHELRNPLGAISAAIDVLDATEPEGQTAGEARAIIARQTRNLAHMMNDLLDVGRVIAGKILLARQPVNLAAVVQRVEGTLAITGAAKEHPLQLHLDDAWVDGDAVRLEQVVTNLLTNAIKYTPAGRPIQVRTTVEQERALLEVQDAGTGIPPTLLPHVFDLFVQGERPLDRRAGGLGIGLTLVRRLVELHGGTVGVESSAEGSRFTVWLPAAQAPAVAGGGALAPARRRQVLVIEDNEDVLAALRAKLELDGHTVSTAADGIEGLSRLLATKPEVSIVDIGLPGLTGFELARHARAAGFAGRMIAISGYGAERAAQDALVAGFDAYLVKPVDPDELRATLSAD
jgi:signal transduction histidine kinase